MSRNKINVDINEVEEIISLKLKSLGGIKSKLNYNNVWTFNKELVQKKIRRINGELFNLYGYTFWASHYNGEDYLGKKTIDRIKNLDSIILAGESFTIETQDILCAVDKFHKNPHELSNRIIKLFEKDRKRLESLSKQNDLLNQEVIKLRNQVKTLEKGFLTLFFNSNNSNNSLNDVISLKRQGDSIVLDELKNIFNYDKNPFRQIIDEHENSNIVNIQTRKKLEDEGL